MGKGSAMVRVVPTLPGGLAGKRKMHSEGSREGNWTGEETPGFPGPWRRPGGWASECEQKEGMRMHPEGTRAEQGAAKSLVHPAAPPSSIDQGEEGPRALGMGEHPSLRSGAAPSSAAPVIRSTERFWPHAGP